MKRCLFEYKGVQCTLDHGHWEPHTPTPACGDGDTAPATTDAIPPVIRDGDTELLNWRCIACGHAPHHSTTVGATCAVQEISADGYKSCSCVSGLPPSFTCSCRGTKPWLKHHQSGVDVYCTNDLHTDDPNRCKLQDSSQSWRCHKQVGHMGACSSHMDCGETYRGYVCGYDPGHLGPHTWANLARAEAAEQQVATLQAENTRLADALQDIRQAWADMTWCGVGNDLTGKADRCDVQTIDDTLKELEGQQGTGGTALIEIKKSPTADTRSCDFANVSKDTLYQSSVQHIGDVCRGLEFFSALLSKAAELHDHDKLSAIDHFHADFVTGFKQTGWWDNHRKVNRHHLLNADGVPQDVNLIDVLDMISDCIMAGMARTGSVYPLDIPADVLTRAFQNTVELLQTNVQVVEELDGTIES